MGADGYTHFTPTDTFTLVFTHPESPVAQKQAAGRCLLDPLCGQWFEARTQEAVPREGSVAGLDVQKQPRAVPRETSATRAEGLLASHPSTSPLSTGTLAEARIMQHPCTLQATDCCWPPLQAGFVSTPQHGLGGQRPRPWGRAASALLQGARTPRGGLWLSCSLCRTEVAFYLRL